MAFVINDRSLLSCQAYTDMRSYKDFCGNWSAVAFSYFAGDGDYFLNWPTVMHLNAYVVIYVAMKLLNRVE